MALQEKLDFIDGEIRKIHMICTKAGYNASQIENFAKPFFEREGRSFITAIRVSGKDVRRHFVAVVTVVVVTVLLFEFTPAFRLVCAISKQGAVQILPLWDWSTIYDSHCLVENPLYQKNDELQQSDCEMCESTEEIIYSKNVSEEMLTRYIERSMPVIVKDGIHDWDNMDISIDELAEIYREHPIIKEYHSCQFGSNIRVKSQDHLILLDMYTEGTLDNFYAHWENCVQKVAKNFRKIYQRPYFLPRTIAIVESNWLFIASNYSGKIFKPINVTSEIFLFMQMKGDSFVKIQGKEPCEDICSTVEGMVHQGEILVITSQLWRMKYLPAESPENIAIGIKATFEFD